MEDIQFFLETGPLGQLPLGWSSAKTGKAAEDRHVEGSVWETSEDPTAPNGNLVLKQVSTNGPGSFFYNVCYQHRTKVTDIDLSVDFKAISGVHDQGGGLVWRYQDAKNYYVARVNPLEDNFNVYKLIDGERIRISVAAVKVPAGEWHNMRVVTRGHHIQCWLDDTIIHNFDDDSITEAGHIGLWTKADAVTSFNGLETSDLLRRVALITGSSSGCGAHIALLLASKGFNVVVNYNSNKKFAHLVAEKCKSYGAEVLICQGNIAKNDDCVRIAQAVWDKFQRLDVLVNNAGTTKMCLLEDLDGLVAEDFQNIFAVNVIGTFQMIRAAIPLMNRRSIDPSVVNISSFAAVSGSGSSMAYAASKGALNTLGLSFARILSPNIRVNTVSPGWIEGRWTLDRLGKERYEQTLKNYPAGVALRKTVLPEDVAVAVVHMIEATNTTGMVYGVDGGKAYIWGKSGMQMQSKL